MEEYFLRGMKVVITTLWLILFVLHSEVTWGQNVVFQNATIVDVVEGKLVPNTTVVINGSFISEIGNTDSVKIPKDATIIDATDQYLIPGLWDMHIHNVNDVNKVVPWNFHSPDPKEADQREIYMPIYLAFGITGTRELSGGLATLELRNRVKAGEILGPHMIVGSPLLDGPYPLFPDAGVIPIDGPDTAKDVVTELHSQGFDFLKPYSFLSVESYRALHKRAQELGMEVAGEIPISVSLWEAVELGQRTVEHLTGFEFACSNREKELREKYVKRLSALNADPKKEDPLDIWNRSEWEPFESFDRERCFELYAHLAAHDTWVVPTLIIQHMISHSDDPELANNPNFKYIDPWSRDLKALTEQFDPEKRLKKLHEHRMQVVGELHNAGINILAGSDTHGGFTLHQELELLVKSGLSPLDALRTATLNPARYLEREHELGSIERGKIADLVLLRANPLEDIRNTQEIEAVMFQGHLLDRQHLDRILQQLETDAQNWSD